MSAPQFINDGSNQTMNPNNASRPISMVLNGTKLKLNNKGRWETESTDLDLATIEIERLLNEKDQLCVALTRAMQQIEDLQEEVRDLNKVKSTTLELVSCRVKSSLDDNLFFLRIS